MSDPTFDPTDPTPYAQTAIYRTRPKAAYRALQKLIRNKEDTAQVFEIMRALSGRSIPRGYQRFIDSPRGGAIAWRREEIAPILDDHDALRALPKGSVGRAYLAFVEGQGFTAEGLAEESRKDPASTVEADHPYAWYARRLRDVHDIWHVLTGYGRDALGEACVVAFSYAQTGSRGFGFIALAGAHEIGRGLPGRGVRAAVWQAYRTGRAAAWLPAEDYPSLLAEPLETARTRLNIPTPSGYLAVPEAERNGAMRPEASTVETPSGDGLVAAE